MNAFLVHRSTGVALSYGSLFQKELDSIMKKPSFVAFAITAV